MIVEVPGQEVLVIEKYVVETEYIPNSRETSVNNVTDTYEEALILGCKLVLASGYKRFRIHKWFEVVK